MKKVLTVLVLVVTAFVFAGTQIFAAGTGNLVVHVQKWDGDYTDIGAHAWGGPISPMATPTGTDDFGIYFSYDDVPLLTEVGFIAIKFSGGGADWSSSKLTNVVFGTDLIVEGKTRHVYLFEGGISREAAEADFAFPIIAPVDSNSAIIVYFDPSNAYEENLGVHNWGWVSNATGWNEPLQIFTKVGKAADGTFVYAGLLEFADPVGTPGAIVYYGDGDASKKTNNIEPKNPDNAGYIETLKGAGQADVYYVLNKGNDLSMDNVWVNNPTEFAENAFSFRLVAFDSEDMSGTYAVDPTTLIVKTSALIPSPYPNAEDKELAKEAIKNWFTVKEVTGVDTYGEALDIERVDFATSNESLNAFVIILNDELDNTKEYEVFFDNYTETLAEEKQVAVTLNLTVPANTPAAAVMSVAGAFQGWTPGAVDYIATQVGTSLMYTLTFNVGVTEAYTTFEYKWTRGSWDNDEFIASNRALVIPNYVDSITFNDVVEAWKDVEAPESQYAAPKRVAPVNLSASLEVVMDTEAPVITFISPTGIVGQPAASRIIPVTWGVPFNQNSFPRFRAADDRDGDLTPFVYVPKGAYSVLNTRVEGDYTIMLRVVDKWGNVTEETFIFRVAKAN
ncbi:MAG: hypothetical protein CVV63_00945 [Tenericutes bacterium HGW-Tenericutes-8]|nr:MAG: hypothetical protein CVV63_00945 [Tenericutes bacterium HGW-Tenericutes-8]PKK97321.1 MAG: hypothetical protein CVV58_01865 [Tenericutes bacterium HGW-Tenericutes-3]